MFGGLSEQMRGSCTQHSHALEEEETEEAGPRTQRVSASLPALLCAHRLRPSLGRVVTLTLAIAPCSD